MHSFSFSRYCSFHQFMHLPIRIPRIACLLILTFLWDAVCCIVVLICTSQIHIEVKYLSCAYWTFSFLWHTHAGLLFSFLLDCLYFSYWLVGVVWIFWMWICCSICIASPFQPFMVTFWPWFLLLYPLIIFQVIEFLVPWAFQVNCYYRAQH